MGYGMSKKGKQHVILVPVDFSAYSEAALLHACKLAECFNTSIVVLHVVHDPADMPGYYKMSKKKYLVRIEDAAEEMFDKFLYKMAKKHPKIKQLKRPNSMLVRGLPVPRILEVAKKIDAAMVVLGSQGRTGLKRMMLGSKAEQVVQLCPLPVTIVKAKRDAL